MENPAAMVSAYKQTFHSVIAMTLWTKGVICCEEQSDEAIPKREIASGLRPSQ